MQSADRILAHRYAQALFEVGKDHKQEELLHQDLTEAMKLLRQEMDFFKHPMMGAARQKTLLKSVVGSKISSWTIKFLNILIDKKRFSLLPLVVMDYGAMLDASRGIMRAQVRSAGKLGESDQTRLKKDLKRLFGKEIALETKESPELLGGMVVRVEDWVLDGSLQGKLRRLAAQLTEES